MFYAGSGPIAANYTLTFQTSGALNNQMQTYIEYVNAMNPGATSIIIEWMLYDQGTGTVPMGWPTGISPGNNGTAVSGPFWRTWTQNGPSNPNNAPSPTGPPFFPTFPMQVGTWYLVHTGIYLNDGQRVFPVECDNNDIYVRVDVRMGARGRNPVIEIRDRRGETIRRGELKNNVEIRPRDERQER